jgi:predicted PurR-regulated permease PerM
LGKRLAIWAGFFLLLYLARDFFFAGFMTYLFSYAVLSLVDRWMRRLSPDRPRAWLRRLLTLGLLIAGPLSLVGVGFLVAPRAVEQGQRLAGWLSHVTLESETARVLEGFVGPHLFRAHYTGPDDPKYQADLEAFRREGQSHVRAYNDFPALEAWVEGGFGKRFDAERTADVTARLNREGTSSKEFGQWFLTHEVPRLRAQVPEKGTAPLSLSPLERAAATASPEQLLAMARRDPAVLAAVRRRWIDDTLSREVPAARATAAYHERFGEVYEKQRQQSPRAIPYTFEQYVALQKARSAGPVAFGEALERIHPTAEGQDARRLSHDFEATRTHELFREWWSTSATGAYLRHHLQQAGGDRLERFVYSFLNVPADLATAFLLTLFICIDYPNLKAGFARLRDTWLRDVYDELVPALGHLGRLIGRGLRAQGLIALCNAVMIFLGLVALGVEHNVLLALASFVLCLVPTLGAFLALALIVVFALVQPGGGAGLALRAAGVVVLVLCVEAFVLSPRILGRMMELHPVLIVAILPLAQYFFGVWGLILATPVAVYVIHIVILNRELPGDEREPPAHPD